MMCVMLNMVNKNTEIRLFDQRSLLTVVHLAHFITNIHTPHKVYDRLLQGRPLIKEDLNIKNTSAVPKCSLIGGLLYILEGLRSMI